MATKLSRKPDDVLRRIGAGGTRATVRRILAVWDRASASDVEAGASWYGADSLRLIDDLVTLSRDAEWLADGAFTREHAATLLAHLSPRTTWGRNTAGAVAMVQGGPQAARGIGCLGANVDRASRAMETSDPLATLNGPKTAAFARNLLGDTAAVTVDAWAARIALGGAVEEPEKALGSVGAYDAVAHAYRLAAMQRGVEPQTMQATTWIVARNGRAT